ncbi:MAG: hypothetical protein HYU67_13855 [Flavobacteriia bacterium]|nr:hypothetical protein [Flavobacteriia bacterium]
MFKVLCLYFFIVFNFSCQNNQSVKKDLINESFSKSDGIGCEKVDIELNGKVEKRNEFIFGEKVDIVFHNISGLKVIDKKTFPIMSMNIIKNGIDTVFSENNLLSNLENGTELSPLRLNAFFQISFSGRKNEKYKVFIEIRDQKGKGSFKYELPFTVKENKLLKLENNGIEYSNIYLWNETNKKIVDDIHINSKDLFILILDDIEGFEIKNEKVFPIFSIEIMDKNGNKILSNPNMLKDIENVGVKPEELNYQLTANISFTEGNINNPCKLVARLKDKNSTKQITMSTDLIINSK